MEGEGQYVSSQEQFGRQAGFYTASTTHSSGESLEAVRRYVAQRHFRRALDVATGTGFTAFAIRPYTGAVVATDVTPAMLQEAQHIAAQRNLVDLEYTVAAAESLPFASGSVDLVTCRVAPHHFLDLESAVGEWRRVLTPGGTVVVADTTTPEVPEVAGWMNDVELRRDRSHVRNLTPPEWTDLLRSRGLELQESCLTPVPMEFDDWVRRSGTPADEVERLRRDFLEAPTAARAAFDIHRDESGLIRFRWTCLVIRALAV